MGNGKITSDTHRQQVYAEIAKLDRRGYTQWDIATTLKEMGLIDVSQMMICQYLKDIRKRCLEQMVEERKAAIAEKIEQYREVRREAWDAWERSKADIVTRVEEKSPPRKKDDDPPAPTLKLSNGKRKRSDGVVLNNPGKPISRNTDRGDLELSLLLMKQIITTEGRLPACEYLHLVKQTIDAEVKLLGLIEAGAEGVNPHAPPVIAGFPWEQFFERVSRPDPVEEKLKSIEVAATTTSNGDGHNV